MVNILLTAYFVRPFIYITSYVHNTLPSRPYYPVLYMRNLRLREVSLLKIIQLIRGGASINSRSLANFKPILFQA